MSNVEMSWPVFAGLYGDLILTLLRQRCDQLADDANLSEREREILNLLLLGRNHEEIGIALGISPRTSKFHQGNVLKKLGADSRLDLVRLFL